MKKIMVTASAFLLSFALATGAWAAGEYGSSDQAEQSEQSSSQMGSESDLGASGQAAQQEDQMAGSQQAESSQVKSTNKIIGKAVQGSEGQEIGNISDLMIDTQTGQVGYALVSSGGVLGMGEDNYIVPWNAIHTDPQSDTMQLNISKDKLAQAPKGQQVADRQQAEQIFQFYGVAPYWEQSGQQQQQQQPDLQMQQEQQQEPGSSVYEPMQMEDQSKKQESGQ